MSFSAGRCWKTGSPGHRDPAVLWPNHRSRAGVSKPEKRDGNVHNEVKGRAAHAGLDPEKGVSAILELARQIERLHALNDLGGGITVNVGVISGGTRSNVVAAEAEAEIDVRFSTAEELKAIERAVLGINPVDERVAVTVIGGINRPPLERSAVVSFTRSREHRTSIGLNCGKASCGAYAVTFWPRWNPI